MISCFMVSFFLMLFISSCTSNSDESSGGAVYVKPSVDKNGRFRKGHIRMPGSTKKDAMKRQNKSRYYYRSRGKYNRKR